MLKCMHKRCDSWLNFIVMHDLEFHICDNLKYWYVNYDKFLGFSDCVVSHLQVIATMYVTGCILIAVSFVFLF